MARRYIQILIQHTELNTIFGFCLYYRENESTITNVNASIITYTHAGVLCRIGGAFKIMVSREIPTENI